MNEALKVLIGPEALDWSANTVSRLKQIWGKSTGVGVTVLWNRDLRVYVWADSVYSGLRAEQMKLCAMLIICVNERGEKPFGPLKTACGNQRKAAGKYY